MGVVSDKQNNAAATKFMNIVDAQVWFVTNATLLPPKFHRNESQKADLPTEGDPRALARLKEMSCFMKSELTNYLRPRMARTGCPAAQGVEQWSRFFPQGGYNRGVISGCRDLRGRSNPGLTCHGPRYGRKEAYHGG